MLESSSKPTVLLVDEDVVLRGSLTYLLRLHHYTTIETNNGEEVFEVISKSLPDAILLEVKSGASLDGFSLLKILKNDTRYKHIPVIIVSELTDETNILYGLELGANDYITKPFLAKEVILKVGNLIKLKYNISINVLSEDFRLKSGSGKSAADATVLRNFALLIETNTNDETFKTVADMAKKLELSVSTLERLVKKNYGCNPIQYVMKRKMEKAHLMLQSSSMTVMEVAKAMGFNSLSYFSTSYKKHFGSSPLKNRRL